jgi:plasmid stabilization system protein ParE
LERFPLSGSIVPELGKESFREIRIKSYRVVYRVMDEDTVEIVTVYHGARLLDLDLLPEE